MITIVPALIPNNRESVIDFAEKVSFVQEVHIDVVDNKFVPFLSWPFETDEEPRDCKYVLDSFSLEVDLMVQNPVSVAEAWVAAGADSLVFHVETISLEAFKSATETFSVSLGICANKSTPFSVLKPYLLCADYVQVMGIAEIGAQGQPFDPYCFSRVDDIRQSAPWLDITIDGSVNENTIADIYRYGIRRCIVGSAIVRAADARVAYEQLLEKAIQQ